jgi:hypothetical protein
VTVLVLYSGFPCSTPFMIGGEGICYMNPELDSSMMENGKGIEFFNLHIVWWIVMSVGSTYSGSCLLIMNDYMTTNRHAQISKIIYI